MQPRDAPAHPARPVPCTLATLNGTPFRPYQYRGEEPWTPKGKR